jgi:hypothetical protein
MKVGDVTATKVEVVSLKRSGATWKMLLTGEMHGLAEQFRREFSSSLQAQEIVFDAEALSRFGAKTYKMTRIDRSSGSPAEREVGAMVLSVAVHADAISLENATRMYLPDGKRYIEYHAKCLCSADGRLSLRRIDSRVVRSDNVVLHQAQTVVERGRIIHKYAAGGKETVIDEKWVDGTLVDLAVFFLVQQLPRKENQSVTIENVLSVPTNAIKKPETRTITCLGIDGQMSTDGQKLTKFVNTAKGEKSGIVYWVDENGSLQRVLLNSENRLDLVTR